jgi:hypothetical protein
MTDVFGLLGELDPFGDFQYSDAEWECIRTVVKAKLGHDADTVAISCPGFESVPLRTFLEIEIGLYFLKTELANRYPPQTTRQIRSRLNRAERLLREFRQLLKTPEVALYGFDWSNDRGGPKTAISLAAELQQQVKTRLKWLSRLAPNEPYPGSYAAPSDVPPSGEGWQLHHRELTKDPEADLVRAVLRIFTSAFDQRPGISETGSAAQFLHATLRPALVDLADSRVMYLLRKFSNEF